MAEHTCATWIHFFSRFLMALLAACKRTVSEAEARPEITPRLNLNM